MARSTGVETLISEAYEFLSGLDLESAQASLERALEYDYEDEELLYAMKCARWWADSMERVQSIADQFEAGEFVIARWKAFKPFLARLGAQRERVVSCFKHFAFGVALARYMSLATEGESADPEIALRLGRASKGRGDYESAVRYLEGAAKAKRDDPAILAELADSYALIDEPRASKALFREAFFLNPQRIDTELLESSAFTMLAGKVGELGKEGIEVAEWIPVLGELQGVFSVKRELKPVESGKLKQSIYELETELAADGSRRAILVPRLINRYFWLVDHYMNRKEDKSKTDELLLKIKLLDPIVYKQYIA
jgi:tetratricopeptide (TPR) repeat protein